MIVDLFLHPESSDNQNMIRIFRRAAVFIFTAILALPLSAQDFYPGHDAEILRGEVRIDMEPIYGLKVEEKYPLDADTLRRRALEEAAMFYSAMIYGWSFHYDIGEKARGIPEEFELEPLGTIPWGDPGLFATDVELRDMRLKLWTDYRLTDAQKRRTAMWRSGSMRNIQAVGHSGPLGGVEENAAEAEGRGSPPGNSDWASIRQACLEDAARAAIRAILRQEERNRPKEVSGFISLAAFPQYWMEGGQWAASARFRFQVTEIAPFAAY
ncbi:hypothetical protein AGMMS49579_05720 [Spirochaetia bacterium]|nr:hypothetical protein AGMMS49579_05720 [Spirochaetia bacterium]